MAWKVCARDHGHLDFRSLVSALFAQRRIGGSVRPRPPWHSNMESTKATHWTDGARRGSRPSILRGDGTAVWVADGFMVEPRHRGHVIGIDACSAICRIKASSSAPRWQSFTACFVLEPPTPILYSTSFVPYIFDKSSSAPEEGKRQNLAPETPRQPHPPPLFAQS